MKNTVFKGMATALVTPMTENGIDYEAFGRLIEFQIENGTGAGGAQCGDDFRQCAAYSVRGGGKTGRRYLPGNGDFYYQCHVRCRG